MNQPLKPYLLVALMGLIPSPVIHAQNTVVTYRGLVQSGGDPFSGAGQFKFALVTTTNASAQATATASLVFLGGTVSAINVTSGGSGYVTPPAVSISGGGGSGAMATAFLSGGIVTSIQVNNSGSGYFVPPTVTIAPPPPALSYVTHWSNDGTHLDGSEPTAGVTTPVNNGLFTARLGDATVANMTAFGAGLFTLTNLQLRLWFNDGTNGFAALQPPQALSAAPYAFVAGSVTSLGDTYGGAVSFTNGANYFSGSGAGLTDLNASALAAGTVADARLGANVARTNQVWLLGGNAGTTSGQHFLGTTDNQPLEFQVNSRRVLRLEDNGDGSDQGTSSDGAPNLIGGSLGNFVAPDVVGATIGGGGATNYGGDALPNSVHADFGVVDGGIGNSIAENSEFATSGGGFQNVIGQDSDYSTIGGGGYNTIGDDARSVTIAGGKWNTIGPGSSESAIGGGEDNTIAADTRRATIAGGSSQNIGTNANYSVIGGGERNRILTDLLCATIAGGSGNDIGRNSDYCAIGGGEENGIAASAYSATIAGGQMNAIGQYSGHSTIGGGSYNNIGASSDYSTIGGGAFNTIQASANYATIPGGRLNSATNYAFAAGNRAKANYTGAFVWADSQDADFASTSTNQFNVRAGGGARFVTSGAGMTVDGPVTSTTFSGRLIGSGNSAGAPGLAFSGDLDTGVFSPSANTLALATGGAERLRVSSAGAVGIGETVPEGQLHITGGGSATPQIKIQTTANNSFVKFRLESFGKAHWDFAVGGSDNVMNWYYSGTAQNLMSLSTSGTLTTAGPVNPPSDRNVKQDFAAVDAVAVLEKVAALPIQSWAYKNSPDTRHIGPVAQDFHAAFRFNGVDDKHISTVDADGVALAAIQGLNRKMEIGKQKAEMSIRELRAENAELKQAVNELKELVQTINHKLTRGAR